MRQRQGARSALLSAAFVTGLAACGGVTKFSDTTPIAVVVPAPKPPEPPPPPPPPKKPKRVEVKVDRIEITEKIQFELDKATIKSESHGLLNEIVDVLKENPSIKKVDIIGHTDSDGADKYNQDLSDRRAKAVLEYLTSHGIDEKRLTSKGMGESKPIADNNTAEGKEKNRRVEFLIVEQEGVKGGGK
jgi:outer membrane protein OmpA-like peptidoglycan-associated protein